MIIETFTGENAWLSNFWPSPFWSPPYWRLSSTVEPWEWGTVEHFFQAAKCQIIPESFAIRDAATPGRAKQLGKKVTLCGNWNEIRLDVMWCALDLKFQEPTLQALLLHTGDAVLQEGNTWNDTFWGVSKKKGVWVGQNHLGELLMRLREEIRRVNP